MRDPKLNPASGDILLVHGKLGTRVWVPLAVFGRAKSIVTWVALDAGCNTRSRVEHRLLHRSADPSGSADLAVWRRMTADATVLEVAEEPSAVWTDDGLVWSPDVSQAAP